MSHPKMTLLRTCTHTRVWVCVLRWSHCHPTARNARMHYAATAIRITAGAQGRDKYVQIYLQLCALLCVCVSVCVCVCVCVKNVKHHSPACISMCTSVCISISSHLLPTGCMHVSICTSMCISICTSVCVSRCISMCISMCTCVCISISSHCPCRLATCMCVCVSPRCFVPQEASRRGVEDIRVYGSGRVCHDAHPGFLLLCLAAATPNVSGQTAAGRGASVS